MIQKGYDERTVKASPTAMFSQEMLNLCWVPLENTRRRPWSHCPAPRTYICVCAPHPAPLKGPQLLTCICQPLASKLSGDFPLVLYPRLLRSLRILEHFLFTKTPMADVSNRL